MRDLLRPITILAWERESLETLWEMSGTGDDMSSPKSRQVNKIFIILDTRFR